MWMKPELDVRVGRTNDVALDWEAIGRDVRRRCRKAAASHQARLAELATAASTAETEDSDRSVV